MEEPCITVVTKQDYRLIRVGVCVTAVSWFGQPVPQLPGETEGNIAAREGTIAEVHESMGRRSSATQGQQENRVSAKSRHSEKQRLRLGFMGFGRRKQRRQLRLAAEAKARAESAYRKSVAALAEELRSLSEHILSKTEPLDDCACVYTDAVRSIFFGEGLLQELWKGCWIVREFVDYRESQWVQPLLAYTIPAHYLLLGTAEIPVLAEIVRANARKMKDLRWILREKDLNEETEKFAEELGEEYGLAVIFQTVAGKRGFRTICPESTEPVCVLDFTEEEKIFPGGLARGSVWLDFSSLEEKERRLLHLAPGIRYYSLKKLWREQQIDTTNKNKFSHI